MESDIKAKDLKFSDYLYILYKWKKFIVLNLIFVIGLAMLLVLLLPNKYKATSTIMIPPETQSGFGGLGGLTSLLGGKSSITSLGSKIFGSSNTSEDLLVGLINSRTALMTVVEKFNLWGYYEIGDSNSDKVLKAIRNDFSIIPNEHGMLELSVIHKEPKICSEIANYMVELVDSLNIEFNIKRAKLNREFVEQRYLKNLNDLKVAEDSLYKFQKKYRIVAVPEQLSVTVKAAAEIETMLIRKEIEAFFVKQSFGENSPQYSGLNAEIIILKDKIFELKNSNDLASNSNVLFPFKSMPDITIQYMRIFREVEIQQAIQEFVLPMYEQAKVEELKSIPTVMVVDKAYIPQIKDSPKRSAIFVGIVFLCIIAMIPFIFWGEKSINRTTFRNPIQKNEYDFFNWIIRLYKLKR